MKIQRHILFVLLFFLSAIPSVFSEEKVAEKSPVPTHADAALILAKHTGFFDRYVEKEAPLNDCVVFLNKIGIYFGLMEVANEEEFTLSDCARAMGQIELVLSGEAEYVAGKVKLPKGIDSWEDFCIMHGVRYVEGYEMLVQVLVDALRYAN